MRFLTLQGAAVSARLAARSGAGKILRRPERARPRAQQPPANQPALETGFSIAIAIVRAAVGPAGTATGELGVVRGCAREDGVESDRI